MRVVPASGFCHLSLRLLADPKRKRQALLRAFRTSSRTSTQGLPTSSPDRARATRTGIRRTPECGPPRTSPGAISHRTGAYSMPPRKLQRALATGLESSASTRCSRSAARVAPGPLSQTLGRLHHALPRPVFVGSKQQPARKPLQMRAVPPSGLTSLQYRSGLLGGWPRGSSR